MEIRLKAPDATKVRLNFWSGPKVDMVRQPDGRAMASLSMGAMQTYHITLGHQ